MSASTATRPRTVTEIVADTLMTLLRARPTILAWEQVGPAMAVLGLTKEDMAEARSRVGYPTHAVPAEAPGADPFATEPSEALRAAIPRTGRPPNRPVLVPTGPAHHRPATITRPASDAGELRCSRCRRWLPANSFRLRTDRIGSGTRRSACDPCHSKANRERYVSLEAKASLNAVNIVLALEEGDAAARLYCSRCRQPLGTDDVTTGAVGLAHVTCPID